MIDLEDLLLAIEEYSGFTNEADILVNKVKYKLSYVYLEDYSDGKCKVVLVGEDK